VKIEYSKGEQGPTDIFEATSMEEAALLVAMAEADRGDTVSAADTLKQIRRS